MNLQAHQVRSDPLEFVGGAAHLGIGAVGFRYRVRARLSNKSPGLRRSKLVPGLHQIRAIRDLCVHVLAHLSVLRRKLEGRAPAGRLRVLRNQEVRVLQRPREVLLQRLSRSVEMILCSLLHIIGRNIEERSNIVLIHVGTHHAAKVGGHEMARRGALAH